MERIRAYQESRLLLTAIELDVFTALGAGATGPEAAAALGTDPRATSMMLNALVAVGLVEKRDGVFRNTGEAARYFAAGSAEDQRMAMMHNVHLWKRWSTLTECVRTGTAVARSEREPLEVEAFIAAMDANASGRAPELVAAVGAAGVQRMLDLGGGSAAYSLAFARANPGLRAEVLDLEAVVPLTRRYIRAAGLDERVTVRAGDMLAGSFGSGYDLVLVASICHMFAPEENRALFKACGEALAPGGRLVMMDFLLDPEGTGPRWAAVFALNMLTATRSGNSYTEAEYAAWLGEAGFTDVRRVDLSGPASLMIGETPRQIR
jgi:SAM-dependent methyltransferase